MAVERPDTTGVIEVLWRPGCPFCTRLRRGLHRAGVATVERDIWTDRHAAARLREVTGGDETVPTVLVGNRALVNPGAREVVDAARAQWPQDPRLARNSTQLARRWWPATLWTAVVGLAWLGLAAWRPETTWHLAPLLLGGVAPWLVGQDSAVGDRRGSARVLAGGAVGLVVAVATAIALGAGGLLRGPGLVGLGPFGEALVLAGGGAVLASASGVIRTRRAGSGSWSAWAGSTKIAASSNVVVVEGNAYFPRDALTGAELRPSAMTTVCPWKGVARYYDVVVDGAAISRAAWSYPAPWLIARRIKNRVAFEPAITVAPEPVDSAAV